MTDTITSILTHPAAIVLYIIAGILGLVFITFIAITIVRIFRRVFGMHDEISKEHDEMPMGLGTWRRRP